MTNRAGPQLGEIYRSSDPRDSGRTLRVVDLDLRYVYLQVLTESLEQARRIEAGAGARSTVGRVSRVLAHTLHATPERRTGYCRLTAGPAAGPAESSRR